MINLLALILGIAFAAIGGEFEVERRLDHIRRFFIVEEQVVRNRVASGTSVLNQSFSFRPPRVKNDMAGDADVLLIIQDVVPIGLGDHNTQNALPTGLGRYYQTSVRLPQNRPYSSVPCVANAHLSIPAHIKCRRLASVLNINRYFNITFSVRKLIHRAGRRFPVQERLQLEAGRPLLMFQGPLGFEISTTGVEGSQASSDNREEAQEYPQQRHYGDIVTKQGASLSSVRRPSLLHQIIALEAMLFGCLGAAVFLGKSFSPSETRKSFWGASGAASAIIAFWALASLIGR